jgi:hypothetical protein
MTREELVELRQKTLVRVERMRKVGDFGAGASDIRENGEAILLVIEDVLERKR